MATIPNHENSTLGMSTLLIRSFYSTAKNRPNSQNPSKCLSPMVKGYNSTINLLKLVRFFINEKCVDMPNPMLRPTRRQLNTLKSLELLWSKDSNFLRSQNFPRQSKPLKRFKLKGSKYNHQFLYVHSHFSTTTQKTQKSKTVDTNPK